MVFFLVSIYGCQSDAGDEKSEKMDTFTAVHGIEVNWITVEGGEFTMGSPENEPERLFNEVQHPVQLSSFRLSKYPVTFAQFDEFCRQTGRELPDDNGWGRADRPVINVTWEDAVAFAEWMGVRLPTEAEWEFACRAGTTTPFSTGRCLSTGEANYNGGNPYHNCDEGQYRRRTVEVGSFEPNPLGLHDMHGNVWEWTMDWFHPYPDTLRVDPIATERSEHKVIRGGGWNSSASMCRCARRMSADPENTFLFVGFRLADDI